MAGNRTVWEKRQRGGGKKFKPDKGHCIEDLAQQVEHGGKLTQIHV